jgi:hypothetical protein
VADNQLLDHVFVPYLLSVNAVSSALNLADFCVMDARLLHGETFPASSIWLSVRAREAVTGQVTSLYRSNAWKQVNLPILGKFFVGTGF